jgi:hypothetical protein
MDWGSYGVKMGRVADWLSALFLSRAIPLIPRVQACVVAATQALIIGTKVAARAPLTSLPGWMLTQHT